MSYVSDANRYDEAQFRRCGRSGIALPPVSLGRLAVVPSPGGVHVPYTVHPEGVSVPLGRRNVLGWSDPFGRSSRRDADGVSTPRHLPGS
jgi:hypothetical protein